MHVQQVAPETSQPLTHKEFKSSEFWKGFFSAFKPTPMLRISEWAEEHRELQREGSAERGRWRNSRTPYLVEIMDALSPTSPYREIVFMKGAQVGATEVLLNWLMYIIDCAPATFMLIMPSIDSVGDWEEQRLAPAIKACSRIASKIPDADRRERGNRRRMKRFPGGRLILRGSKSAQAIASNPARYIAIDDADRAKQPGNKEGDLVTRARLRMATDTRGKMYIASTPTIEGESIIYDEYQDTDRKVLDVPCPHCETFQTIEWERIIYDKANPLDARLMCESCGVLIENKHKLRMLVRAKWRATNPDYVGDRTGFLLSGLYSPFHNMSWGVLAKEWETALKHEKETGSREKIIAFENVVLARVTKKDVFADTLSDEILSGRFETYEAEVPDKVLQLTATVDVQQGWLACEVVGWAPWEESFGITFRKFQGDTTVFKSVAGSVQSAWEELDEFLRTPFKTKSGLEMRIAMTLVDAGDGNNAKRICSWTRAREGRRIYACKGASRPQVGIVKKTKTSERATLYLIDTVKAKDIIFSRLKKDTPGPGYCHFPNDDYSGYDFEYRAGLMTERREVKYVGGEYKVKWVKKKSGARNEPIDLRVYNTAAIKIISPKWDVLERRRAIAEGKAIAKGGVAHSAAVARPSPPTSRPSLQLQQPSLSMTKQNTTQRSTAIRMDKMKRAARRTGAIRF